MNKELNLSLYRTIYLIRRSEQAIKDYYDEDEMKTPMHMSEGSEAIVAGVCSALTKQDQVFGTYRSHALYLAKTEDSKGFFAELYGKDTAIAKGKAGSMHLSNPEYGYLASSAIVGSTIPVAVGTAFANKYKGNGRCAAVFFGDGATDEGVFWESMNFACASSIPMLFVCEDNGLSVHTDWQGRRGYSNLIDVASQFKCEVFGASCTDVELVHELSLKAKHAALENQKPSFMVLKYYRYLEHVGVNLDFDKGYREETEFARWHERDPIKVQKAKLISEGLIEEVEKIEHSIDEEVERSVHAAKDAPFASIDVTYHGVFYGE